MGTRLVAIHATDANLPNEAARVSLWRRRKIVNGRLHVILPYISHRICATVASVILPNQVRASACPSLFILSYIS